MIVKITKHLLYSLVVLIIISCGANKKYHDAKSSNSILEYERYLDKYPESKYVNQAKEELKTLYEERDWRNSTNSNSIALYIDFISKYPNSKYSKQAKQSLNVLYEERDWNNASRIGFITEYKGFISKYPNSKYAEQARLKIAEIEESNAWEKSKGLNTIYGYQNFMISYPNSKYGFDARNKIEILKDENAWKDADKIRTVEAYKSYIAVFPYGTKRVNALEKIRELEVILPEWNKTLRKNTPEAYRNFIQSFSNSYYAEQARERLKQFELNEWNNSKRKNTIGSYEKYLSIFPDGKHVEEASKRIVDIEVDAIFKGSHGALPPMNRVSSSYSYSTTNDIQIYNNTSYTLTVRYSGTDSRKIVIKPKMKEKIILINGAYRVTASVNTANVRNYAGNEKLEGGEYNSEYYIVTEPSWRN